MNPKLDINDLLNTYLKHWKWFALSCVISIFIAFAYLRYSIPQYSASAKIQIIEDKGASSELSVLQDLDVFSGGKTKIEDEIEILKSRSNFIQVVKKIET